MIIDKDQQQKEAIEIMELAEELMLKWSGSDLSLVTVEDCIRNAWIVAHNFLVEGKTEHVAIRVYAKKLMVLWSIRNMDYKTAEKLISYAWKISKQFYKEGSKYRKGFA